MSTSYFVRQGAPHNPRAWAVYRRNANGTATYVVWFGFRSNAQRHAAKLNAGEGK